MSRKLLILGSGGRLGAALCRGLGLAGYDITGLARPAFDLQRELASQIDVSRFDLVINAAAATNVDWCEDHPEEANRMNGYAVGELAALCRRAGVRCIHVSTDYVFDGKQTRPYTEEDRPNPLSAYGRSKLLGEKLLGEAGREHLIIRVSWVFGPDKPSFLDFMLDRARKEPYVEAVSDKFSTPTYTPDFVQWVKPLLFARPAGGCLHLCNQGQCTWQELAQVALDCAHRRGLNLQAREVRPLALSSMRQFRAIRPVHTVLNTGKFVNLTGEVPRPWPDAVEAYLAEQPLRDE